MGKKYAREQKRMDHLRRLAGVFDSPKMQKIQERVREEQGDCWDCKKARKVGHITAGGGRLVVISCLWLSSDGAPVVRRLPFRCGHWEEKPKLRVLEGGREDGESERGSEDEAGASARE